MKKVLIIDDDPFIRDVYSKQLKREGYAVDVAPGKEAGVEKIINTHPDLLILDLNLGDEEGPQEGLDVLRMIRQNPQIRDTKVIVVSNYTQDQYSELSHLSYYGVVKVFLKVETTIKEVVDEVHKTLR